MMVKKIGKILFVVFLMMLLILGNIQQAYAFDFASDISSGSIDLLGDDPIYSVGVRNSSKLIKDNEIAKYNSYDQDMYLISSNYTMNSKYFVNDQLVDFSDLSLYFSTKITITEEGTDFWNGVGLVLGYYKSKYYYMRLQKDGNAMIISYNISATSNPESIIATKATSYAANSGETISFSFFRTSTNISIWINEELIFDQQEIPKMGNKFGVCFIHVGLGSFVFDSHAYFKEDVRVEVFKEKEYPSENISYEKNTDTIIPVVEYTETKKVPVYSIVLLSTGGGISVLSIVFLLIKIKGGKR